LLKELEPGKLAVVGTGFYITRYGLFLTAGHVLSDLADLDTQTFGTAYVFHLAGEDAVHIRRIRRVSFFHGADLAIGQADNFLERFSGRPLVNLRAGLSVETPTPGAPLTTYAYPENKILDFTRDDADRTITADFFDGSFLRCVGPTENPFLPYPHLETTIEIRSGASGGPVFERGRVVGVNCRGWDFRGGEHEGDNLSCVVPISAALPLEVKLDQLPPDSWEYAQIPESRRDRALTVRELGAYGHVQFEPGIKGDGGIQL
jgi:hypothetical protein